MATTRLLKIRINRGKSIAATLALRTDYVQDSTKVINLSNDILIAAADNSDTKPIEKTIFDSAAYATDSDKTKGGELVLAYMCAPRTADEEFMLTKRDYDYLTSREQGDKNVLAYHIRQSFKPGEVSPDVALKIGYELGMKFTKGRHAFIVATHTDRPHIHNHIVFNSTALCGTRKFKDFWHSALALRKISDLLCLEHGLSVIKNPKPSKGKNYNKWLGNKEPSWQEKLRRKIDEVLPHCDSFEHFLALMKTAGYMVNDKRKHITFLAAGQKKPTRMDSLKGEHTEQAVRERIERYKAARKSGDSTGFVPGNIIGNGSNNGISGNCDNRTVRVSWLIDIQEKIQQGKGAGYEHWAHIHNIKEMSKTILFLKEQGIESYDELSEKSSRISAEFTEITSSIKAIETRQKEISELQRHIGNYGKTRDVYTEYKRSGFAPKFYEENRSAITLHETARNYFNSLAVKKLPKISELKQEYAKHQAEKKKLYSGYHKLKDSSRQLLTAKHNAQKILDIKPEPIKRENPQSIPGTETLPAQEI